MADTDHTGYWMNGYWDVAQFLDGYWVEGGVVLPQPAGFASDPPRVRPRVAHDDAVLAARLEPDTVRVQPRIVHDDMELT